MTIQRLKSSLHLKLISACYHSFLHLSEESTSKTLKKEDLVDLLINSSALEKCDSPEYASSIQEFRKLSKSDQKEYLITYIFTDKDYKI